MLWHSFPGLSLIMGYGKLNPGSLSCDGSPFSQDPRIVQFQTIGSLSRKHLVPALQVLENDKILTAAELPTRDIVSPKPETSFMACEADSPVLG